MLAAALVGLGAECATAGVLIEPVVVELAQVNRATTIRITNQSAQSLRLQATVSRWSQAGADRKERSDELLVVPPIAEIAPGASQLFRVALRRPQPAPRERAYRLLLEDVSAAPDQAAAGSVQMRLNHDLPVLVAPAGPPVRVITWADCGGAAGAAQPATAPTSPCLRLTNQGNLRFKFDAITLTGPNGEQRVALPAARNLLAGSFLDLPLPADVPPLQATRVVVVHAAQGEPVQAQAAPAP